MQIAGRQILSAEQIELRSEQLLMHFSPRLLEEVRPIPLRAITEYLSQKHGVIFRFDDHLGFSEKGERILGAFNPKKRVILVDASLKADEHKFNFTLAHELGHLALHRKLKIVYDGSGYEASETVNEKVGSTKHLKTETDWIEWQANYYASALLMPKQVFTAALVLQQRQLGISRTGKIFVDNQRQNQTDYFQLISLLSEFMKVSQTAVEIRLNKLGLVDDRRGGQSLRSIMENFGL